MHGRPVICIAYFARSLFQFLVERAIEVGRGIGGKAVGPALIEVSVPSEDPVAVPEPASLGLLALGGLLDLRRRR
jgi:hypothetical protein